MKFQQVTDDNIWHFADLNYTASEEAFAYVYISHEDFSFAHVYIDDVTITYTPTKVIQYSEYYPFGLQTGNSWTRDNSSNNFLYDAGSELNKTSGWYDLPYRNYDPALGRFFQIDPMAQSAINLTPFTFFDFRLRHGQSMKD